MNRKALPLVVLICVSMLACSLVNSITSAAGNSSQGTQAVNPSTQSSPSSPTQSSSQSSSSGPCSNLYYPVKKGATWTYMISGLPTGASTYVDTVTDVRSDGFTDTAVFDNKLTRASQWSCAADGLLELSLGNAAAITATNTQAQFTVTNSSGVTLPSNIAAGQSWSYKLDIQGTMSLQNNAVKTQGTTSYQMTALGNESVTVPGGTFNAMKLQISGTFDIQVSVQGNAMPFSIPITATAWYAPNVGMVKQAESANMMGNTVNATTELQSYNIP